MLAASQRQAAGSRLAVPCAPSSSSGSSFSGKLVRASPVQQTGRPGSRRLVVQAVSAPDTASFGIHLISLLCYVVFLTSNLNNRNALSCMPVDPPARQGTVSWHTTAAAVQIQQQQEEQPACRGATVLPACNCFSCRCIFIYKCLCAYVAEAVTPSPEAMEGGRSTSRPGNSAVLRAHYLLGRFCCL